MKKEIGKAMIAVGTNVGTLGVAGVLFTGDKVSVTAGALAVLVGALMLLIGIKLKEVKNGDF